MANRAFPDTVRDLLSKSGRCGAVQVWWYCHFAACAFSSRFRGLELVPSKGVLSAHQYPPGHNEGG